MSILSRWRNPMAVFAVSAMLAVAVFTIFTAAADVDEAADSTVKIAGLSEAAAAVESGWSLMMRADALAATGQAPAEAQAMFDQGQATYNAGKLALSTAGIEQVDQALAGTDQGLAGMIQSFGGTMQLAQVDVGRATANHLTNSAGILANVQPAIVGLGQVVAAGDDRLVTRLNNGGSTLRLIAWLSAAVAALGMAFAAWSAWSMNRREDDDAAAIGSAESEIAEDKAA